MRHTLFYILIGLLCLIISIYILRNIRENFKEEGEDEELDYKDSSAKNCKNPSDESSEACFWCKGKKHDSTIESIENSTEGMVEKFAEFVENNPCYVDKFQSTISKNKKVKNTLKKFIETILK
jgi:hypothetical protein